MNIKYIDAEDSNERDELIKQLLPKQTIISEVLEPLIEKTLFKAMAKCVRMELEIYHNYPKKKREESKKEIKKTFDPRNNGSCFMAKAFKSNDDIVDAELTDYRKAIGTIPHHVWGNCTLLEIWGGDHFEDHPKMVNGAFAYGLGFRKTCPTIKFYVNPIFKNRASKNFKLSDAQREQQAYMDELMTKAMLYGVKTLKQARADMKRRRKW